jgi:uncharacterized protein (TIGR02145 family)
MKKMWMMLLIISISFLACEDSVLAESEKVALSNTQTCPYDSLANELVCSEKTYKTVVIGDQIWMAENLNFGSYLENNNSEEQYQNGGEKFCYNDKTENCDLEGGLYQWHTAMNLPTECGDGSKSCSDKVDTVNHQGLCPNDWHMPSAQEWDVLAKYLGGDDYPDQVAEKLRALSYNGKDEVGFSALGSGIREYLGYFRDREGKTAFWMTKEENSDAAFYRGIWYGNGFLAYFSAYKKSGFSIRCLKN